jgi:hypothetical protein
VRSDRSWREPLDAVHERPQRLGHHDAAVGLLAVLQHGNQRAADRPEPFSVWTSSFLPCALRKRACIRRAWKASQFDTDEISR